MSGITIDPLAPLRALAYCVIALAVGILIGGVPAYFIGKAHEAEKRGETIGTLKTSVDSCNVAAGEAKVAAEAAKAASTDLNSRIDGVISGENAKLERQLRTSRDKRLAYVPPGATECERTVNAVRDQLMGGRR